MSSIRSEVLPVSETCSINNLAFAAMNASHLAHSFQVVRHSTEALAAGLSVEDQNLQSMPEASPVKWHRAHTTWFFETFILVPQLPDYQPFDPDFAYLFNSYYNGLGRQFPRSQRSLISRPDNDRVQAYREHVDQAMLSFVNSLDESGLRQLAPLLTLGLNHEQQHQELIVTDLKHALSHNPAYPAWTEAAQPQGKTTTMEWVEVQGGLTQIGGNPERFCFDNETPRHPVYLADFLLANRPVNCGEYRDFIDDGGYRRAELWLSDGWDWVQGEGIRAPLYWLSDEDGHWHSLYTLGGVRHLDPDEPVCHVSFYEAFAYAQWANARLATEAEWERASGLCGQPGHFADSGRLHPAGPNGNSGLAGMFGDVWEWTASSYAPYPGYKPAKGAVGEYNGKFMANQMVLKGGSCATPAGHIRPTYRNFFYPSDRWQFSGFRLARDLGQ